jgi:DNA polymerase V
VIPIESALAPENHSVNPLNVSKPLNDGQHAGFPSPADDYLRRPLDLNDHLVPHPTSTFFFEVQGHSAIEDRIFEGDILVVDRAMDYRDGDLVLAVINGEFAIHRLRARDGLFWLWSRDGNQEGIPVTEDLEIWGRVMWSITRH